MLAPLNVFADLRLETENGKEILVSANRALITVTLPTLWLGRPALRPIEQRSSRTALIGRVQDGLKATGLQLELRCADVLIAELNPGSRPTILSSMLGLGSLELNFSGIVRSLFLSLRRGTG